MNVKKMERVKFLSKLEPKRIKERKNKIFNKKTFMPTTQWSLNFLSKTRILPMYWESSSTSFHVSPRWSRRMIHYYIGIICLWSEYLFLTFRFVELLKKNWPINKSSRLGEVIALLSFMAAKSMAVAGSLIFVFQHKGLTYFTNQLIKLRQKEGLTKDLPAVKVFLFAFMARASQMFLVSYIKPNKAQFWWSILSPKWKNLWVFTFHLIFNAFTSSMFVAIQYFLIVILCYTHYLQHCFRKRFTASDSALSKLLDYRKLQILAIQFKVIVGAMAIPYITVYAFTMTVILSFACIRYYDTLDIRVYLQMPLGLLMISLFAAAFYTAVGSQPGNSQQALNFRFKDCLLKEGARKVENRMYLRSCKLISLFKIRRRFLLSLTRFVVFQTTRMLIVTSNR